MNNPNNIALTNDDGIDAPGIQALYQAVDVAVAGSSIGIVAPNQHLSGCSHQINRGGAISVEQELNSDMPLVVPLLTVLE